MNKHVSMLLVVSLSCGSGCDTHGAEPHGHDEEDEHGEVAGEAHPAEDGVVRVDQGMLRDLRVTIRPAESRPAGEAVTVLGDLRVNEDTYAEVGTPVSARVARVLAAPGDKVTEGQPLVELDSPEVGRARAALLSAKARLDLAQKTAERRRGLVADRIVSEGELQVAESELAQADAEDRAARESLAALSAGRGSGARFILVSPIAGTVIERSALRGRLVGSEQPLFVVGELSELWLVVHAFERDALRVRVGATAKVTFPALPGQAASGVVTQVGGRVDPASRTVDVRIVIDNPSGVLRPGMSAVASLPIGNVSEQVVTVPVEALQRQPEGWCVFVPKEQEGVFELRSVGRGRDLGGEVEVVFGLTAGERVVVDGAFLLRAEADKARGAGEEHHH
jgi:membrane fusion protein, heavy metal efflux system